MKLYKKSELIKNRSEKKKSLIGTGDRKKNMEVLLEARKCWDALENFRVNRKRNRMYTYGNQWGDRVYDKDTHSWITEETLIKREGKVPLKNNMIRQIVKSVIGQYRSNQTEPVCSARDRDEQKLGEMMSIAVQYCYQLNHMHEVDARELEEYLISGVVMCKTYFSWMSGMDKKDVWNDVVNLNRAFFDNTMEDIRLWDCNIIGEIHDLKLSDVVSSFATSKSDEEKIRSLYKSYSDESMIYAIDSLSSERLDNLDFFRPSEPNLCRVIEVWRKESKPRYRCHDILKGELYKIEINELPSVLKENEERKKQGISTGIAEDDIPYIEYEWYIDRYWKFYFLTPSGETLSEGESPYWHKEHPYTLKLYPYIDGEVHSFVEDIIDQQRYINRLITMVDFIMGASAKGILMFPEDCIPEGYTMEDISEAWTKYNSVIFVKLKPGAVLPQQISTNATNVGAYELLNIQLKLLEDISGVHGAIQGKTTGTNTAASLYAQQAQNSSTNLIDIFDSFKDFREQRDTKMMKLIQQYYDDERYINIAGRQYSEQSKMYNPEKVRNTEFDLAISESTSSPAYRMVINDILMKLLERNAISVEQFLENGDFPFADRLLQSIERDKQNMANGQAPEGIPDDIQQQINAGTNPNAIKMIRA